MKTKSLPAWWRKPCFEELLHNLNTQSDARQWYQTIPKAFWTCRPADDWHIHANTTAAEAKSVQFSGAVLLKIRPTERLSSGREFVKQAQQQQQQAKAAKQKAEQEEQQTQHPQTATKAGKQLEVNTHYDETVALETEPDDGPKDSQVRKALSVPTLSPLYSLYSFIRTVGALSPTVVVLSALVVSMTITLQAVGFKILFEFEDLIGPGPLRVQLATVMFAVIAGMAVLNIPLQLTVQRISRRLEDQFRIALYEKLPRLKDEYFTSRLLADLIERSHAVASIEDIPSIAVNLIQSLVRLIMVFLGLIYLYPDAAHWLVLYMLSCLALPMLAQKLLGQKDMITRTLSGTLSRHYSNALLGLFTVKVHSGERTILNQQQESLTRWAKASNSQRRAMVILSFAQDIITYTMAALLIGHAIFNQSIHAMNILYVYWLLQMPIRAEGLFLVVQQYPMVRNIIMRLQEPLGSAEDPVEHINEKHRKDPPKGDQSKGMHIQCNNASFSVDGQHILDNINLDIQPGSHIAIVGASGAGKSTFVSGLLGFGQLDEGELLIDGLPLCSETTARVRRESTWLDPQVYLFKNSIVNNITYGSGHTGHMGEVLDDANLWPLIEGLPDSIHTDCGEAGSQLSGGEGQRIRLARALNKPDIRLALLDEPFRGLDKPTRQQLMHTVRRKWKDVTLICVIHDVSEALQFDQVAVFEQGRIVELGDPRQLAMKDGPLTDLLDHEEKVATEWLSNDGWRRISVVEGQIREGRAGSGHAD